MNDRPTPGYTLVNLWMTWKAPVRDGDLMLWLKLDNLGIRLAYNATTVPTMRALSPLPGRALSAGLRWQF